MVTIYFLFGGGYWYWYRHKVPIGSTAHGMATKAHAVLSTLLGVSRGLEYLCFIGDKVEWMERVMNRT